MKNMTLSAIAHVTNGQLFYPENYKIDETKEIQGAVTDNRQIGQDFLFIPMVGARVDGHDFIEGAYEKGAYACLSERKLEKCSGPYILVESSAIALKQIAAFYREQLTIPVIGVIGSVGKTSTKEMITSVLSVKYNVLKTEGNFNNEIGLPLTICRIRDEHEVAVVEMGISDFGEMDRLGQIAKPNFAVMTNIGQCHLEFLHDRDGILRAKTEVFAHMPKDAVAILNGDDDKLIIADTKGIRQEFYGLNGQKFSATNIGAYDVTSTKATIHTPLGDADVVIPLPGEHNVMNALAAAAVATELSMTLEEIVAGIEKAQTISGRNNVIKLGDITVIDDCYNANPGSMKASLGVLSKASGRKIAVLGDMGELGEDELALHYGVGKVVDECNIDVLYTAGTLSKEMSKALVDANSNTKAFVFDEMKEMTEALLEEVKSGDTILIKASHFMNYPHVVDALVNKFKN